MNNIVLYHKFNDVSVAHVSRNMKLSGLLRHPSIAMRYWTGALGSVLCTNFTNYDTIINSRVEHLEHFNGMFANHALFGDGTITLCPFGVQIFDGPHLRAVVYMPNISYIFVHTKQDICVRYGIRSYNHRGNNALIFLIVYESICFVLDIVPIMSQKITC